MAKLLIFYFVMIFLCSTQFRFTAYPIEKLSEIDVSILYKENLYKIKVPKDSTLESVKTTYPEIDIDWHYFNPNTPLYHGDYIVIPIKIHACISINHAEMDALITLPGIKRATAQKIIDYRIVNGLFQHLEDLMKVRGIKESKYNQLKDHICL